jgi:hypothetical protein
MAVATERSAFEQDDVVLEDYAMMLDGNDDHHPVLETQHRVACLSPRCRACVVIAVS